MHLRDDRPPLWSHPVLRPSGQEEWPHWPIESTVCDSLPAIPTTLWTASRTTAQGENANFFLKIFLKLKNTI